MVPWGQETEVLAAVAKSQSGSSGMAAPCKATGLGCWSVLAGGRRQKCWQRWLSPRAIAQAWLLPARRLEVEMAPWVLACASWGQETEVLAAVTKSQGNSSGMAAPCKATGG